MSKAKRNRIAARKELVESHEDQAPHELEFTTSVAAWITLILEKDPSLPFVSVKCESRTRGLQKRRDLSLIGRDGKALVTGEVKLPHQRDGATPYHADVIRDARRKALRAGAPYFFTWNVNDCVLWKAESDPTDPTAGQHYRSWKVTTVTKDAHLTLASTEDTIKRWLGVFVHELSKIVRGTTKVGFKLPDERFIEALESALSLPVRFAQEELERHYSSTRGRESLDRWMRDEQGWTLSTDPEGIRSNLERASKFACYALVNKLVFYEALMKRYGAHLSKLSVPDHIDQGDDLRLHLEGYFAEAKKITGDYETVFGEDHSSVGSRIPFYSDSGVSCWRGLINQIHQFDFSKLDYEIIGAIFERLISPEERHKFGQFYTRSEVVDLINSFCIRSGEEAVLDPACGGGTFLVRAYARKRELAPGRAHEDLLDELYGGDISPFASHLTTINLATRDLIQDENYPRVARADFFDLVARRPFIRLPSRVNAKGLGRTQHRDIEIPMLDAVIGNPPYVRQEDIRSDKAKGKGHPRRGTKEYYRQLVKREVNADLSGRSDLHCYFWPHASTFLKPRGWLCLLTSSQWLDVEYGFRLQAWIVARFKIIAVLESVDEPWFVGARVTTAVTILQQCDNARERAENLVRFAQLRRPIAELLTHDGTTAGAVAAANTFRDEILNLTSNTSNLQYRCRLVRQRELVDSGVLLGQLMQETEEDKPDDGLNTDDESDEPRASEGSYYGAKWGIHLRAPDLWFEVMDQFGDRFSPLGRLAVIRRGVTSGKDEFFYPRDISGECLDEFPDESEFRREYGVARSLVADRTLRMVRCGDRYGEIRPIEAKYLEPEVHSLMEVSGYEVTNEACSRLILLVSDPKSRLKGSHVLRYIEWGESKGWHRGATCAARATEDRAWYDLTGHPRGAMFWPKSQQYKHVVPVNGIGLQANCNLYAINARDGVQSKVLAGILNSSWCVLAKYQYGRPVGNEGNLKTEVVDVTMMPVPDPRKSAAEAMRHVEEAFEQIRKRDALQFLSEQRMRRMAFTKAGREAELSALSDRSELEMPDRRKLDDAVLQLLGVSDSRRRDSLLVKLYAYLGEMFEAARQKEEKAIANKNKTKRRGGMSASEVGAQLYQEIKVKHSHLLRPYADFIGKDQPFSTFEIPAEGVSELHNDMFAASGSVRFTKGRKQIAIIATKSPAQADLISLIASNGVRGLVRVPLDTAECENVARRYKRLLEDRAARIEALAADRTGDEDLQDQIRSVVTELIHSSA